MNLLAGEGCDDLGLAACVSLHNTRAARQGKEQPNAKPGLAVQSSHGTRGGAGFGRDGPACPTGRRRALTAAVAEAPPLSPTRTRPPRSPPPTSAPCRAGPRPHHPPTLSPALARPRHS